jgi:hypothetical protein
MMRSLQTLVTRPEQFACSETNTAALIAYSAGSEFQTADPLPKCVQEEELGKYRRGGFKSWPFCAPTCSPFCFIFAFLARKWGKGEREKEREKANFERHYYLFICALIIFALIHQDWFCEVLIFQRERTLLELSRNQVVFTQEAVGECWIREN